MPLTMTIVLTSRIFLQIGVELSKEEDYPGENECSIQLKMVKKYHSLSIHNFKWGLSISEMSYHLISLRHLELAGTNSRVLHFSILLLWRMEVHYQLSLRWCYKASTIRSWSNLSVMCAFGTLVRQGKSPSSLLRQVKNRKLSVPCH